MVFITLSANRKERNGVVLAVFYDGALRVDNFSNKCLTNAEVAFLECTLGNSVYMYFGLHVQTTNVQFACTVCVFISDLT